MILSVYISFADMPGNRGRQDITLTISGIQSLQPYSLFVKDEYVDSLIKISADTTYIITGSRGAPHDIFIFAEDKNKKTDSVHFDEMSQENAAIVFAGVSGNKLQYTVTKTPLNPQSADSSAATQTSSQTSASNKSSTTNWLIGISVSALVALIIFFVVRNQKKNKSAAA